MNLEIYNHIYKSSQIGCTAVSAALSKVTDDRLRAELSLQIEGYKNLSEKASDKIKEEKEKLKKFTKLQQLPVIAGVTLGTMLDSSSANIAEILINGLSAGVVDITKVLNAANLQECDSGALSLGVEATTFQQQNIDRLKSYL